MRSMVFPACVVAVGLSIAFPAMAADPAPPAGEAKAESIPAGNAPITFEQYRAWRLAAMERRLSEIDMQLGAPDLSPARKARLEETRAYYKWLAGLPEAERDKRFRERFDRIDANHDGVVDAARARRLARAAAGLLRRRGQGRIAPAGERAAAGRESSRTGKRTRPRRQPPPDRLASVCCFFAAETAGAAGAMLSCAPSLGNAGLPTWPGSRSGRPSASFRRCVLPRC